MARRATSAGERSTTSLYVDEADVSTLNIRLHRATGNEAARFSDLLVYVEAELAAIVRRDRRLAYGQSKNLTDAAAEWWRLPADALHGDLEGYIEAWQATARAWPAGRSVPVGAHLVALSALTHRQSAWLTSPADRDPPRFPFKHDPKLPKRQRVFRLGPFPGAEGRPEQESRPTASETAQQRFTVFKRNRLIVSPVRTAGPLSIAVDRVHHNLFRKLLGGDVINWLARHWVRQFTNWHYERYTDAPIYAGLQLSLRRDMVWLPNAIRVLQRDIDEHMDVIEDMDWLPHASRILAASGPTVAARIGHAFDVDFDCIDDLFESVQYSLPFEQVGLIVLAQRLRLLDTVDIEAFDATAFEHHLYRTLGVSTDDSDRAKMDACLRTLDDFDDPLHRYGAAQYHADEILKAYLRSRSEHFAAASLLAYIARAASAAWFDRAALHRFLGIPLNTPFDEITGTRAGVRLASVPPSTWRRVNQILRPLDEDWRGRQGGWLSSAKRRVHPLDASFVKRVIELAQQDPPDPQATKTLAAWMYERASTTQGSG